MKTLALDPGDAWTGIAISDALGMLARPLTTVATTKLETELKKILEQETITQVVVGYPKTMKDTESEQTKKAVSLKESLEKKFSSVSWILWDERLTSQQAAKLKKTRTKEEKLQSHARAAAFILQTYLDFKSMQA